MQKSTLIMLANDKTKRKTETIQFESELSQK